MIKLELSCYFVPPSMVISLGKSRSAVQSTAWIVVALVYYPRLSNPKAPNEYRVLVYACPDCTDDFDRPKMFSIRRNKSEDPLDTVEVEITQIHKKAASSVSRGQHV